MFRLRLTIPILLMLLVGLVPVAAQDSGPSPQATDGFWQGDYYDNETLSLEPAFTRSDAEINFNWGQGKPAQDLPADHFSVRWKRYIEVPAPGGQYRFRVTADDGIRVYVDDNLLIDEWYEHPVRTFTAGVNLEPGHHLVTVEYYERAGEAVAQLSWSAVSASGWHAEYFDNRWLNGSPHLVRNDDAIDFDWGRGGPDSRHERDQFSARWTRQIAIDDVSAGTYRFNVTADDGIRLWVDGELLISEWSDHPAQTYSAEKRLERGTHDLKVEYYENQGLAVAKFWFESLIGENNERWQAEYFNNPLLNNEPVLTRADREINFDWGDGSPAFNVAPDDFSVRWSRTLQLEPGTYRFTTTTDDGVRLWVDGHLLIDQWREQAVAGNSATISVGGDVPVKMEYYERAGLAVARLQWERVSGDPPPSPPGAILVDDRHGAFVRGGADSDWHTAGERYDGRLLWTRNSGSATGNYNWARWYAGVQSGRYEVFVYIPDRYTTTTNARYWVRHRDGYSLQPVDQSANGGRWVSLGIYWFEGGNSEYVSLADVTFETNASRLVAYDAVRWEPR